MSAGKHRVRSLPLCLFGLTGSVLRLVGSAYAWEGAKDNKPFAALERMFDFELAGEGRKACLTATMAQFQDPARVQRLSAEAHAYLEKIRRVAQQRDLHEHEVPAWVGQMHQAIDQQAPLTCHASWERVIKEHLEELNARHK